MADICRCDGEADNFYFFTFKGRCPSCGKRLFTPTEREKLFDREREIAKLMMDALEKKVIDDG